VGEVRGMIDEVQNLAEIWSCQQSKCADAEAPFCAGGLPIPPQTR
jgi:hypothetical protein